MQEKMLKELQDYYKNLKMGHYTHYTNSLHVYERHFDLIENVVREPENNFDIKIPRHENWLKVETDIPVLILNGAEDFNSNQLILKNMIDEIESFIGR